jgi:RND family efflux transporter MFP subunit
MSSDVDIKQLAIVRDEPAGPTRRRRRHIVSRYVVPGVLLVGFLSLVFWASRDTVMPPRPVWVVPVLASQSAVQHEGTPLFQAAGWIEPRPTPVRIAALAPGVVERLLVVEDQPVKAGEPVAELVKDDARLAYERAQANLKLREAELHQVRAAAQAAQTRFSQPVHLEAALGEAEASLAAIEREARNLPFQIRRAEAQLEFAESDYKNKQAAEGAVAGRVIDQAKSVLDAARASVEELRNRSASLAAQREAMSQRREALRTQLHLLADETQAKGEAEGKLQAAAARVEQARVSLAEAKLRLDRMTVRAPIDGRVYQIVGYPGTTLTGGMGPLPNADGSTVVTLYRPEMLQIRVDVRFEDIPKVSLGQPVQINNPALASPLAGQVLFVSSEADIQKNTLQVKVAIDSPQAVFKPEMLVDVTFQAPKPVGATAEASEEMRLYVPQQLIQRGDEGTYVWVADQSAGVARRAPISTGRTATGGLVEVTRGLTVASRLIARGQEGLADGDRIRVVDEESSFATNNVSSPGTRQIQSRLPGGGE